MVPSGMGLAGCGMEQAGSSVADAGLVACAAPLHRDMAVVAREAVWADAAGTVTFPMGGMPASLASAPRETSLLRGLRRRGAVVAAAGVRVGEGSREISNGATENASPSNFTNLSSK